MHTYSCPHKCDECNKPNKWNMEAWAAGNCVVCGGDRHGNLRCCEECWEILTQDERHEVMKAVAIKNYL